MKYEELTRSIERFKGVPNDNINVAYSDNGSVVKSENTDVKTSCTECSSRYKCDQESELS